MARRLGKKPKKMSNMPKMPNMMKPGGKGAHKPSSGGGSGMGYKKGGMVKGGKRGC